MTDDERFEEFLRKTAADYEAPRGEVPREAMWNAIRDRRPTAPNPHLAAPVIPQRRASHRLMWMGMAATLLLGVAVGRFAWRSGTTAVVAVAPASTAPAPTAPASAPTVSPEPTTTQASTPRTSAGPTNGRALAGARATSYTLAANRHLENVEALLTTYAASTTDARSDSVVARWAKNLLGNTRLLLDSPAARDPVRERLLRDLEVILVQLVQRSPGGDAEERSSLERTLDKTQIIPRLRSAVPASLHSGTD